MSCNATLPVSSSSSPTAVSQPACKPLVPVIQPWAMTPQSPVMRSKTPKYAGLPDRPDRAGMRERRKQADMTVRELQRQRGVAPVESTASWWLDACYRQLSTQITSLPSTGFQVLQSLTNLLAVDLGPQGCEAAPVVRTASALDDFQQKFSTDFEIWLSPSARRSEDMKGMVIVIGEHHYAPEIQARVKRVMLGFRQSRGDRFFIEGGERQVCVERVTKYAMELSDCRMLEKDFPEYSKLEKGKQEALHRLGLCVDYLRAHVPMCPCARGTRRGGCEECYGVYRVHSTPCQSAAIGGDL